WLGGFGGVFVQGQSGALRSTEHASSSAKFCGSGPLPTLDLQSLGSEFGAVVTLDFVPSAPVLSNQQFPVLPLALSHQNSVPFGFMSPFGATPMMLSWN